MTSVIDGIRYKLDRAEQHVRDLREAVTKLDAIGKTDGVQACEIYPFVDPETPNELSLRVRINKPPDPYWGAILGDAIQNCRAILDHIQTALVDAAGGNSSRAYYPIYKTEREFNKAAVPTLINYGICEKQRTLLAETQPYRGTVRPITQHPAWALRKLANIDKHRALVPQVLMNDAVDLIVYGPWGKVTPGPIDKAVVLTNDAEIQKIVFVDGRGVDDVNVKGNLLTTWYAEDWPLSTATDGVLEWVGNEVVPRFEPFLATL